MTIEADIKTVLDAYGGLTALISTRIYNERLPQQPSYPNIFYSRVSTEPGNTLTGRNILTNVRFSFEVRATDVAGKNAVVKQLIAAMEAATTYDALYLDEQAIPYEDDYKNYRSDVDFSIWFIDT